MFEGHDRIILEVVREAGLVAAGPLASALKDQEFSGRSLADILVERESLARDSLLRAVAAHLGADYAADVPSFVPEETAALIDGGVARSYGVVPLDLKGGVLTVLATDPLARETQADLSFSTGREVRLAVADPAHVAALVRRQYGADAESIANAAGDRQAEAADREDLSDADLEEMAGSAPIIRFVNLVLAQAIRDRASDLHFEPFEREFKIRCRVDGTLFELAPPPRALALPVISRLKVLANLDIAERRVPQDGRIKLTVAGRLVDLRVSTLPTQFGESVVLRVLDQSATQLDLAQLGLPASIEGPLAAVVARPHGILLVTGPTGSGKTTTLYGCLQRRNKVEAKLLTVEDPVEYEIEGVMQVPVNPAAGLTFARALRAFLRQDPDVVMVGEIRDAETAQVAAQASLTGHFVLSTLHTNDAPGAISRLADLGVERFLLASTVEAVLAQRLVRRVCPECREKFRPAEELLRQAGLDPHATHDGAFYRGRGCAACQQTGFCGRVGIFELLLMTDELRELVVAGATPGEIRQRAIASGLVPLRTAGMKAVFAGETTLEEILKYT